MRNHFFGVSTRGIGITVSICTESTITPSTTPLKRSRTKPTTFVQCRRELQGPLRRAPRSALSSRCGHRRRARRARHLGRPVGRKRLPNALGRAGYNSHPAGMRSDFCHYDDRFSSTNSFIAAIRRSIGSQAPPSSATVACGLRRKCPSAGSRMSAPTMFSTNMKPSRMPMSA